MYMYRLPGAHPDDQVWLTGVAGLYSENDSWGLGAFHRMSVGGDKWRIEAAGFRANLHYDYFGIGGDGGGPGVPLAQPTELLMGEALRRIAPSLYFGVHATAVDSEVGLEDSGDFVPPGIELPVADINVATLAPTLQYDTRDSEYFPTQGFYGNAAVAIAREGIGSDLDYEKISADLNHYRALSESSVLAWRVAFQYVAGDAPFFVYPTFGSGADLRGYQTGTYRDRFLFAMQTEYRHRFAPRIGAVVFAGIGTVSPDFGDWERSLPSVGAGFRYTLATQNNLNLRLDVARGRDDTIWYVGLREAF
jgi:Omp85 superfamily domain